MNGFAKGFFGALRVAGVSGLALAGSMTLMQVGHAQDAPRQRRNAEAAPDAAQQDQKPEQKADQKDGALPIPPEAKVETKHDWTAGARAVHYTATAGTLLIKDDEDKPIGSMFYVAYTEDGVAPGSRPVTFLYNGGPGSASLWLHMGSVGPVRVVTDRDRKSVV